MTDDPIRRLYLERLQLDLMAARIGPNNAITKLISAKERQIDQHWKDKVDGKRNIRQHGR